MTFTTPPSLQAGAIAALAEADLTRKCWLTQELQRRWATGLLSVRSSMSMSAPDRPGRPQLPLLLPASQVPKRGIGSLKGRIALVHALCHIELNAIDLALDIVARFCRERLPMSFFDGWMQVAAEEAKHFGLLRDHLATLGAAYGDLPAHDGLWEAATVSTDTLRARLALVPLVLEARGLDVTPPLIEAVDRAGDKALAAILRIIYDDEQGHVAVAAKWFRFLCRRDGSEPAAEFRELIRTRFRGQLKPPFNDRARSKSGITPAFYRSLSSAGNR